MPSFGQELNILDGRFWASFEPILDRFNTANIADDVLQIWSIGKHIAASLGFDGIRQSKEVDIGPSQLKNILFW